MSMPVDSIMGVSSAGSQETLSDSGFFWRESGPVRVLVCQALEDAGFANGFSTRLGGVSPFPAGDLNLAGFNEDTAENIAENRRRFLGAFPGKWQLATVWQAHGSTVKVVSGPADVAESDDMADAVASNIPGVLCGVKTADCVPVLIADPTTGAFVAVHAGWRGSVSSIAAEAVATLVENYGSHPRDMIAAIGPAACGRNYEVGDDVISAFAAAFPYSAKYFTPTTAGHALVDLHAVNRDQLYEGGVRRRNIFIAPLCTMERVDIFFSYRKEKKTNGKTGRLLSVIGRSAGPN